MTNAVVISAYGSAELNQQVSALGEQGYRIITVFSTAEDRYEIVAQKSLALSPDDWRELSNVITNAVYDGMTRAT